MYLAFETVKFKILLTNKQINLCPTAEASFQMPSSLLLQ